MLINDRLSTVLTQHAGEMAFVQRSLSVCRQLREETDMGRLARLFKPPDK